VQRVVAVESVRGALLAKLDERLPSVVVGDPRSPETRVSALIDPKSTARVREWVDASVTAGAKVAYAAGQDLGPTVLTDVPDGQLAWDEEIFGPVIAVRSVHDLETAFETVNASRYGLHASVFTSSLDTAFTAIDRLDVGGVVVNEVPGFRVRWWNVETPDESIPYSGIVVLLKMTAPAARNRAAAGASSAAGTSSVAAVPWGTGVPRVAMFSLTVTGTPSSGPAVPARQRSSDSRAASRAPAGSSA
jgi:hypothetical protein